MLQFLQHDRALGFFRGLDDRTQLRESGLDLSECLIQQLTLVSDILLKRRNKHSEDTL